MVNERARVGNMEHKASWSTRRPEGEHKACGSAKGNKEHDERARGGTGEHEGVR